ncbi:MAG: lipocalin family protein [Sediminibacterium sp.]|nr:lipocalin family protein [Sediminibacterium sp.]MDP3128804.1 lipocalin family protein [Sediminibacterium sp.]
MKKISILLFTFILGCRPSNDHKLIGEWVLRQKFDGDMKSYSINYPDAERKIVLKFNPDKTMYFSESDSGIVQQENRGTYKKDGDKLYLYLDGIIPTELATLLTITGIRDSALFLHSSDGYPYPFLTFFRSGTHK